MLIIQITLFLSLAFLLYIYIGYPLFLWGLSAFRISPLAGDEFPEKIPEVSIIIPAKNESDIICSKIINCLELEYPKSKLEILVIDDSSDDATGDMARSCFMNNPLVEEYLSCRVIRCEYSEGKAGAINLGIKESQGEYLLFSDADCYLNRNALSILMQRMIANAKNACVGGRYMPDTLNKNMESVAQVWYWNYENFIRRCESLLGGLLGASGALYLVRRRSLTPLPTGLINDDFVIPMRLLLKGHRTVYEPLAVAHEHNRESGQAVSELRRRTRIMAGNWQHLFLFIRLLGNAENRFWPVFQMFGHKLCRVLSPLFLMAALFSNVLLVLMVDSIVFNTLLVLQLASYSLALTGCSPKIKAIPILGKFAMASHYFVMINTSAIYGFFHAINGLKNVKWGNTD